MQDKKIFERLKALKIIPVVSLENVGVAKELGEILIKNNLPCAEITFRTDATIKIIEKLRLHFPNLLLLAGTVLNADNAMRAVDAGASLVVSPGLDPKLVEFCLKKNIPCMPGVASASEIQVAYSLGLSVLKFFPAVELGGIKMLNALSAPFKNLNFVPTGGINKENILDFLSCNAVLACGGTWLVKKELLESENYEAVDRLISETVDLVKNL